MTTAENAAEKMQAVTGGASRVKNDGTLLLKVEGNNKKKYGEEVAANQILEDTMSSEFYEEKSAGRTGAKLTVDTNDPLKFA
jgi:hypothetical protein